MLIWVAFTITKNGLKDMGSMGHAVVDERAPEHARIYTQISLLHVYRDYSV